MTEDPIEQQIRETVERQRAADAAGMAASFTPLPGPLRDAFAPVPDIAVGGYKVRPFYDADFEFLSWLEHPIASIGPQFLAASPMEQVQQRFGEVLSGVLPSGPAFWQLAWLLTRPVEECDEAFRRKEDVKRAALREFGKLRTTALQQLYAACFRQFNTYWSTALEYGPVEEKGEANGAVPFDRSGGTPTGSAGCSTSVAA